MLKHTPKELADIDSTLADIYYGNFSVFQSLPDAWATISCSRSCRCTA